MKSIWTRTRDFFSVVSKDTHLWVIGVLIGAVILSASFYLEPFKKDFFTQGKNVNAAEKIPRIQKSTTSAPDYRKV